MPNTLDYQVKKLFGEVVEQEFTEDISQTDLVTSVASLQNSLSSIKSLVRSSEKINEEAGLIGESMLLNIKEAKGDCNE